MRIFFDVDYTIHGTDGSLRPGTYELFQMLKADGHSLYIWSGVGIRWTEVKTHGLEAFVTDCYMKPRPDLGESIENLGFSAPDLVVDDYPAFVEKFGGICLYPYYYKDSDDHEMDGVYEIVQSVIKYGKCQDHRYYPKRNHSQRSQPA